MMSSRTGIGGAALLFLCILASRPAISAERNTLPGWGPFKFAMSLAQAKAAIGSQAIIDAAGNMNYETVIDGRPFEASISFAGDGRPIQWVELNREGVESFSIAECHRERELVERGLSRVYGEPDVSLAGRAGSMPGTRANSTAFRFKSGAEIELYEQWRSTPRAPSRCAISIIYRPAATRAKENF